MGLIILQLMLFFVSAISANTNSVTLTTELVEKISSSTAIKCPNVNLILDQKHSTDFIQEIQEQLLSLNILSLILNLQKDYPVDTRLFPTKYQTTCSLILAAFLPSANDTHVIISNSLLVSIPGAPHRTFFLVFTSEKPTVLEGSLKEPTKFLQNVLIVFTETAIKYEPQVFYKRNWNNELLIKIGDSSENGLELETYFPPLPNFEGNDINGVVCAICAPKLEKFKTTGVWDDYMIAAMYYVSMSLNASLELQAVFALPADGLDEEGNFDDFAQPLVDGIAALSAILKPTVLNRKFVYTTRAALFDSVNFIHAWPRKHNMASMLALKYPLSNAVWLGTLLSILVTFVFVELFIYWRGRFMKKDQSINRGGNLRIFWGSEAQGIFWHFTLFTLVFPMLDQNGLASRICQRRTSDILTRLLVGIWFLILIVLSCAYKSRFISFIVLPQYVSPPTNFEELVNSDYKIGATFFTNYMDKMFLSLNNRIGAAILKRAVDEPYFSPECYHSIILEKQKVCIGFNVVFETLANEFLTDINNKRMFVTSKDAYFPGISTVAVSRNFPYLVEPYDRILGDLECTGLWKLFFNNNIATARQKGRATARALQHQEKVYDPNINDSGAADDGHSEGSHFAIFTLKILLTGISVAATFLFLEIIYSYLRKQWHGFKTLDLFYP